MVHGRIVDTAILTAEASRCFGTDEKIRWTAGLERLCRELAGVGIRADYGERAGRHDGLEEVLATRELVIWCLENPEELMVWAVGTWGMAGRKGGGSDREEEELAIIKRLVLS